MLRGDLPPATFSAGIDAVFGPVTMFALPPDGLRGRGDEMTITQTVTVETMKQVMDAFNRHDLDAIMTYFAEDSVLEMPRGADPWGTRLVGKSAVREGLASRFAGIPDVRYLEDRHWVCGDRGCSEWLLTGTDTAGQRVAVRGCDLWEFRDGLIIRKDSYWKIVG
jgi:ketosteroid isomerase-like protein